MEGMEVPGRGCEKKQRKEKETKDWACVNEIIVALTAYCKFGAYFLGWHALQVQLSGSSFRNTTSRVETLRKLKYGSSTYCTQHFSEIYQRDNNT